MICCNLNIKKKIAIIFNKLGSIHKSYLERLKNIEASPKSIAAGVAIGVFFAFSPLFGAHMVLAVLISWLLSANIPSAVIGTTLCNPLTAPIIFGIDYKLGKALVSLISSYTHSNVIEIKSSTNLFYLIKNFDFISIWYAVLQYVVIGSLILGFIFSWLFYLLTFFVVQKIKRNLLLNKQKKEQS